MTLPLGCPVGVVQDLALPGLTDALDPLVMEPRLQRHAAAALDACQLAIERIRLVRHKPGRRAVIEYHLRLNHSQPARLVAKVRARGADGRTFRLHQRLEAAGFRAGTEVFVPGAVALVPEAGLWLQRWVDGTALGPRLGTLSGPPAAAQVAAALARLQQAEVTPEREHGAAEERCVIERELTALGAECPGLRPRLARILAATGRLAGLLDEFRATGHRDFYQDQLLLDGHATCLLDLDLCSLCHPALDAGNFVAHLIELGLRTHGDPRAFAPECRAFEAAWLQRQGQRHRQALADCTTLTLARHIGLAWRLPGRRRLVSALLDLTEARLGGNPACAACW